jgi:hypothetical protein
MAHIAFAFIVTFLCLHRACDNETFYPLHCLANLHSSTGAYVFSCGKISSGKDD